MPKLACNSLCGTKVAETSQSFSNLLSCVIYIYKHYVHLIFKNTNIANIFQFINSLNNECRNAENST